jgi:hypothetical protein
LVLLIIVIYLIKCCNVAGDFSLLSVLSEGWAEILGRLIFDLEAPLGRVERVAAHLQLDLLHATVSACCPSLQLFKPDFSISGSHLPSVSAWAKISLNASSSQVGIFFKLFCTF